MSTLHKVKAYFGMAPMEDYDDDYYYDDEDGGSPRGYTARAGREDRFHDDARPEPRPEVRFGDRYETGYGSRDYDDLPTGYRSGYEGGYDEDPRDMRMRARELERPRFAPALRGSTRGALAMDPRRMAMMVDDASPLSKITTLRPKDYGEARTIGERFRDGNPVIMDLVSMDNADAKRLVDFAAGLAFALRGSFEKVATKVFLLSPADVNVSAEERRQIVETGFYAYR